jgi:hypothetical protein
LLLSVLVLVALQLLVRMTKSLALPRGSARIEDSPLSSRLLSRLLPLFLTAYKDPRRAESSPEL